MLPFSTPHLLIDFSGYLDFWNQKLLCYLSLLMLRLQVPSTMPSWLLSREYFVFGFRNRFYLIHSCRGWKILEHDVVVPWVCSLKDCALRAAPTPADDSTSMQTGSIKQTHCFCFIKCECGGQILHAYKVIPCIYWAISSAPPSHTSDTGSSCVPAGFELVVILLYHSMFFQTWNFWFNNLGIYF